MSELDEKLKAILIHEVANPNYDNSTLIDYAVEEIKQVFTEAGYRHNLGAGYWSMQLEHQGYMIGSEWYERFREEMQARFIPFARSEDGEVILLIEEIDEAAKRAANIQENQ